MAILYFDLVGGMAGDMTVASLLELGVPLEAVQNGLETIGLKGVRLGVEKSERHSLKGTRFVVEPPPEAEHGHHHHHHHHHRDYTSIRKMIGESALAPGVREKALKIFACLAEAEGTVHGVSPENVTFHEVGAWDSIADIIGTAIGIEYLAPQSIYCSAVPLGGGMVKGAHGMIPVPAPATLELLKGFPVVHGGPAFERTTPTGAAILGALARPMPEGQHFVPERIGIGLGSKDSPEVPNLLRAVWGRIGEEPGRQIIECAEVNLDDANPEWIGFVMERLLGLGALDVATIPLQMKKNRPGTQVQVIYMPHLRDQVLSVLFSETTTLGVRFQTMHRIALERHQAEVSTPWGEVGGKVAVLEGKKRFSPEFEDCRALALQSGVPLQEIYQAAQRAYLEKD